MKGTQKLFVLLALLVLAFGFVPLFAQRLPYKGLDWLAYQSVIYYGDDYEPDDSMPEARPFPVNSGYQSHTFHDDGDQDWIFFSTVAGAEYTIVTWASPLGSAADTVLELFNSDGQLVGSNDDGPTGSDARLEFQAAYTGTYYARVTEWADRYGAAYWYYLRVIRPDVLHSLYLPLIVRAYP